MKKPDKVIKLIKKLKLDKEELCFLQGYLEFHTGLFSKNTETTLNPEFWKNPHKILKEKPKAPFESKNEINSLEKADIRQRESLSERGENPCANIQQEMKQLWDKDYDAKDDKGVSK